MEQDAHEPAVIINNPEQTDEDKITQPKGEEVPNNSESPSIEIDEDGKERRGNRFFNAIRDFFNAPNMKITHGKNLHDVPTKRINKTNSDVIYSIELPTDALASIHERRLKRSSNDKADKTPVAGILDWKRRGNKCYGIVESLYDKQKNEQRNVGDPVADCLAIVARSNNCILVLADGVNWGERSMLAARSSVYGSVTYLTKEGTLDSAVTTKDVFRSILRSFETAQSIIMEEEATLTTLCIGVVVELAEKDKWGFCVVNVGDSLAFVYNEFGGVREVTVGSHALDKTRDMRYSGGALGPADGYNPDLTNLTCSYTPLETGDIVYLTSDGVSDNFDPVVGRFRFPRKFSKPSPGLHRKEMAKPRSGSDPSSCEFANSQKKLENILDLHDLSPRERHQGMLHKMQCVIECEDGPTGTENSAINVCAKFMNFVISNTNERRMFLEGNSLADSDMHKLSSKERKEHTIYIKSQLETKPGKLDHASIVAFQVGRLEPEPLKRVASNDDNYVHIPHAEWDERNFHQTSNEFEQIQEDLPNVDRAEQVNYNSINRPGSHDILNNLFKESSL